MGLLFTDEETRQMDCWLSIYEQGQMEFMEKLNCLIDNLIPPNDTSNIEHIKSRTKSKESIAQKLYRLGLGVTSENAITHLTDIAGIRIICSFTKDIPFFVDALKSISEVSTITEKDYVATPKTSGYRSFHIILQISVKHRGQTYNLPIEVQIRTAAMDFWASLEHKVRYKYGKEIPQRLSEELIVCAEKIAELDERMFLIHEIVSLVNQDMPE